MDDAEADEEDHADDQGDDRQEHFLGGGFGLGFDGGGLVGAEGVGFGGEGGADAGALVAGEVGGNYKSLLQQLAQREHGATPTYHVLDEKGPDHSKCFKISARVGRQEFPPAWGRSKKQSEQRAAKNALANLRGESAPHAAETI